MESLRRKVLVVVLALGHPEARGAMPLPLWPLYLEKPSFLGKHSVHPPSPPSC